VTPLQRLAEIESLVEIRHQVHVVADRPADRFERRDVVGEPVAAEPQLESREAAFVTQRERLVPQ
jgi:hypothetical protein